MRLLGCAAGVMLAGLALVLAMVIGLAEPGLAWSLIGYATICAGMGLGLAGAVRREQDYPKGRKSRRAWLLSRRWLG